MITLPPGNSPTAPGIKQKPGSRSCVFGRDLNQFVGVRIGREWRPRYR